MLFLVSLCPFLVCCRLLRRIPPAQPPSCRLGGGVPVCTPGTPPTHSGPLLPPCGLGSFLQDGPRSEKLLAAWSALCGRCAEERRVSQAGQAPASARRRGGRVQAMHVPGPTSFAPLPGAGFGLLPPLTLCLGMLTLPALVGENRALPELRRCTLVTPGLPPRSGGPTVMISVCCRSKPRRRFLIFF